MKPPFDQSQKGKFTRELLIGLGTSSVRKSHYPELQHRLNELERFRLLLDQAREAIFLVDRRTGCIVDANATACTYCACLAEDLIGSLVTDWLLTDTDTVFRGPEHSVDGELRSKTSKTIPVDISTNQVEFLDGTYLVVLARDSTQRKRAEEHLTAVYEELHANYEELQALYQQVTAAEIILEKKVEELEASQSALAESEARYRLAIEGTNDAIWDWDICRGRWLVSDQWFEKLGVPAVESSDYLTYLSSQIHTDDVVARLQAMQEHLDGKTDHYEAEYRLRSASGQWIWILSKGKALFDADGIPVRVTGSYTDITERKRQEDLIRYNAYHDSLTCLQNRFSFNQALGRLIKQAGAAKTGAIFLFDLDNFKLVNDSWGHSVGDKLLQEIAARLNSLGESDAAYRLGGDEFVVMLDAVAPEAVGVWAERILALFDRPAIINKTQLLLSASIGVARCCADMTADDVLRQADIALHQAKAAGKRTWRLYQPEMQVQILERIQLESELRCALTEEQFLLYYQPQYALSGYPAALEALLRWKHPVKGMVPPLSFIPVAEETGLIVPLGEWVLRSACRFGRSQSLQQGRGLRIAVNVSARQLMQDDFTERVVAIITEENYPPELLELELTESVLMESFDENVQKLKQLRKLGIRIALDDFGTGYSSLTYLSRLPIDTLKIDKAFLLGEGKVVNAAIVGIIIQLAHQLNMSVVAEGVETQKQLDTLRSLGCDYMQGFLTNPPLAPELVSQLPCTVHPAFLV